MSSAVQETQTNSSVPPANPHPRLSRALQRRFAKLAIRGFERLSTLDKMDLLRRVARGQRPLLDLAWRNAKTGEFVSLTDEGVAELSRLANWQRWAAVEANRAAADDARDFPQLPPADKGHMVHDALWGAAWYHLRGEWSDLVYPAD